METPSVLTTFCNGNPPETGGFPSEMSVIQIFDNSLVVLLNKRTHSLDGNDLTLHDTNVILV